MVALLLASGASVNLPDASGCTPLAAAEPRGGALVALLLGHGADHGVRRARQEGYSVRKCLIGHWVKLEFNSLKIDFN